jgi:gamma-glutamylcyclotransferase (GGCT)/AIG2-like uncharacterized protein YtfP
VSDRTLPLFAYGTLAHGELASNLLGRSVRGVPARLPDFEVLELESFRYPLAFYAPGETVEGRLYRDLTDDDYARLDEYEGVSQDLYQRTEVEVDAGEAVPEAVFAYLPTEKTLRRHGAL